MLTVDQIRSFHQDGFLKIKSVFEGRELELLRDAATKVEEDAIQGRDPYHYYYTSDGRPKVYYRSERMWGRADIFAAATANPRLLACIGQCIGDPFYPLNSSLVNKLPGADVPIRWHQDAPYKDSNVHDTYEVPHFTVDIYFDDTTIENSCLWGILGHHLVGHVDLAHLSEHELFTEVGAVPFEMSAGDVLFHCLSAPHGSMGNRSTKPRRILYLHYTTVDDFFDLHYVRFTRQYGENIPAIEFLRARARLGLPCLEDGPVQMNNGEQTFEFLGQPKTPSRYWRDLIDRMPEEEKNCKRRLDFVKCGFSAR